MTTVTLDSIVKNVINQRRYSLHWYMEFLIYAADCLREITFDSLQVINTKLIPVNQFNEAFLPNDYQDYVFVGGQRGQKIYPLVETNGLSQLNSYDSNFNQQTYADADKSQQSEVQIYNGLFPFTTWYTIHYNSYGENTGRYFGSGGIYVDTYTIVKAQNKIQLNESVVLDSVYLQYISNGQNSDAATTIDGYAQKTIEAYIMWQFKENNRTYTMGERQVAEAYFNQQHKILRARKSDLTPQVLKRFIQKNSFAANKN